MMRNRKRSLCAISILTLAVTYMIATTPLVAQQGGAVQYVYDENGRLHAVVSPTGETTVYTYDAAGNLVSVTRQTTPIVSISGFSPTFGTVGATVTVFGSGFSVNPAEDIVKFNGVVAIVTAATLSQLTTTVPAGASTGPITVVTPNGNAASHQNFVVRPPIEITSFDPFIGTPGTPVTVLGNGFDESIAGNTLKFNGFAATIDAATGHQIYSTVPPDATSGQISVTTAGGTAVSSGDFFVPPSPYSVDDVDFTDRLVLDQTKTITISASQKIALLVFDGTEGQKVRINTSNVTFFQAVMNLYAPDGSHMVSTLVNANLGSFTQTLPTTGTYTILVSSFNNFGSGGSLNLTISLITDFTAPITAGGAAVDVAITTPGQSGILSFSGTAGQRVSLAFSNVTIFYADISLLQPDGSFLAGTFISTDPGFSGGGFIDTLALPVTGTYTIVIEPYGETGSTTTTLYNVTDVSGSVVVSGPPVAVTTIIPGQNAAISFNGTAGQVLDLNLSAVTFPDVYVSVYDPNGQLLVAPASLTSSGGDIAIGDLPVTGVFTILVDPLGPNTGSATLTLAPVQDASASMTIGGGSVTVTTHVAGQNAQVTFSGNAGQRVFLSLKSVTIFSSLISVRNPDGTNLVEPIFITTSGGVIDINNLPTTGTYTIFIDPLSTNTGSITIQALTTGSLTIGGPAVYSAVTTPGQTATYSFDGIAGRKITIITGNNTFPSGTITIRRPDGSILITGTLSGLSNVSLDSTGVYTMTIDPGGNTGIIRFNLRNGGGGSG